MLCAIEYHLADLADLAIDNGIVFARNHFAGEHSPWIEVARAGIQLNADVRGNHGAKNGDVVVMVDTKKDKQERVRLAARNNSAGIQEKCAGDNRSSQQGCTAQNSLL